MLVQLGRSATQNSQVNGWNLKEGGRDQSAGATSSAFTRFSGGAGGGNEATDTRRCSTTSRAGGEPAGGASLQQRVLLRNSRESRESRESRDESCNSQNLARQLEEAGGAAPQHRVPLRPPLMGSVPRAGVHP